MDLDETIEHCEEVSKKARNDADSGYFYEEQCLKYAEEQEQLAEWLTQLKRIKEAFKTGEVMNIVAECMSIWGE